MLVFENTHLFCDRFLKKEDARSFFRSVAIETGGCILSLFLTVRCTAVQPHCTYLRNFAVCETADPPLSAPARLGCSSACTAFGFAQKNDANPVGGRGISGFCTRFFSEPLILLNRGRALLQALTPPPENLPLRPRSKGLCVAEASYRRHKPTFRLT